MTRKPRLLLPLLAALLLLAGVLTAIPIGHGYNSAEFAGPTQVLSVMAWMALGASLLLEKPATGKDDSEKA